MAAAVGSKDKAWVPHPAVKQSERGLARLGSSSLAACEAPEAARAVRVAYGKATSRQRSGCRQTTGIFTGRGAATSTTAVAAAAPGGRSPGWPCRHMCQSRRR